MKKTLIALSVLVAAGSVNAATVYDADGVTVTVYGDSQVSYEKDRKEDTEARFEIGDADFGFTASSAINGEYTAFTKIEFDGDEGNEVDGFAVDLDDLIIGVKGNGLTVQAGKQVTYVDDIGLSNDFNFGLDTAENYAGLADAGNQVLKVQYDADAFSVGLTTAGTNDGVETDSVTTDESTQLALYVGFAAAGASVDIVYADQSKDDSVATSVDKEALGIEVAYSMDAVTLKGIFTTAESGSAEYDAMGANINYAMDKSSFNLGAVSGDKDGDDVMAWYANASYALAKNVTAYVEISNNDDDSDATSNDMGYAAGMTMKF